MRANDKLQPARLCRNARKWRFPRARLRCRFWLVRAELARKPRSQTPEPAPHERKASLSHPRKRTPSIPAAISVGGSLGSFAEAYNCSRQMRRQMHIPHDVLAASAAAMGPVGRSVSTSASQGVQVAAQPRDRRPNPRVVGPEWSK
jgi:hypothetical protein